MAGGIPVVEVPEEIDIGNAASLRAVLTEAADQGHVTCIVDLSQTVFCDTAGLHVLVVMHKRALAEGGELRLVVPRPEVLRVFAVTGIDRVIPHFASLQQAVARDPRGVRGGGGSGADL
jgi:anti-sigma B factor antagonist